MKQKGKIFSIGTVDEWLDCGNKDATVYTSQRVLEHNKNTRMVNENVGLINSEIIEPCYIANGITIKNSKIGPHVSIDSGSIIEDSEISNSIIQSKSTIKNAKLKNSMIGNHTFFDGHKVDQEISIGDFCEIR
jgi:glucose-1-phosphate thymidylyltransferase